MADGEILTAAWPMLAAHGAALGLAPHLIATIAVLLFMLTFSVGRLI